MQPRNHEVTKKRIGCIFVLALVASATSAHAQAILALGVFEQRCGVCHTKPDPDSRTPDRESLRQRTPEAVLDAITTGSMKTNADGLTDTQKRMIAEYITERPLGALLAGQASAMPNHCPSAPLRNPLAGTSWNGWGADEGNSRFQPARRETRIHSRPPTRATRSWPSI